MPTEDIVLELVQEIHKRSNLAKIIISLSLSLSAIFSTLLSHRHKRKKSLTKFGLHGIPRSMSLITAKRKEDQRDC